jgi:hypothetical protein
VLAHAQEILPSNITVAFQQMLIPQGVWCFYKEKEAKSADSTP